MVDSVNNSASLDVSGVENLKFKYTIYWIYFRKKFQTAFDPPPPPPHLRKIMLQIFYDRYGSIYASRYDGQVV